MSRRLAGLVLGLAGLALLAWVDWRLTLGVALALWGNNVALNASNLLTLDSINKEPKT